MLSKRWWGEGIRDSTQAYLLGNHNNNNNDVTRALCFGSDSSGDLYGKINKQKGVHFPEEQILDWCGCPACLCEYASVAYAPNVDLTLRFFFFFSFTFFLPPSSFLLPPSSS